MPRITFWTLMGLATFLLVIGSILPSFFLIFGVFFIAFGLYIGSKPRGVLKKEQTLNNQEVLTVDDQNKSSEVSESSDNSIRESKALAIEIKNEIKMEDKKPEVVVVLKEEKEPEIIVIPKESVESKKEIEDQEEKEKKEIEKEEKKGKSHSKEIVSFFWGGGLGPLGWLRSKILSKEQVVESWSILIKHANGKAEEVFGSTEFFIKDSKAPTLRMERRKMIPGFIRGMFGTRRDFLVVADTNFRLKPFQVFINARDYGASLDCSWYLTYRVSFLRALFSFIPGIGTGFVGPESLDLFDQQDLIAYVTVCHHSTLDAVENLMLALDQDPSKIDRKSRGFFGIS